MKSTVPRWRGAAVAGSFALLVGLVLASVEAVSLAVLAFTYAAAAYSASPSEFGVNVVRRLDDDTPSPGQPVRVTLEVENSSGERQPDVRVYDSPPEEAEVVDGSPSFAVSLEEDGSYSESYMILAPRGSHEFGEVTVEQANLPRTKVTSVDLVPDGDVEFTCETILDGHPFLDQTVADVGRVATDDGGEGTEFHSTREYRRGDPVNRIDWRSFARTGEPSTVLHREQRAVEVVFLVDDRVDVHREPVDDGPDSLDLTVYAASKGVRASIDDGNSTGVTSVGGQWIPPGSTESFAERAVSVVEEMDAGSTASLTDPRLIEGLTERLPKGSQVVFCTPAVDEDTLEFCRRLVASDHRVTVVSPDVTASDAVGSLDGDGVGSSEVGSRSYGVRLSDVRRRCWVERLREEDVPVADWSPGEPLSVELARLRGRWSR